MLKWSFVLVLWSVVCYTSEAASALPAFGLRTGQHSAKDVSAQPLSKVQFSWKLPSFSSVFIDDVDPSVMHHARKVVQRAFEVELFDIGGRVWRSGKVETASQHLHLGDSADLKHETEYRWRVRAWIETTASGDLSDRKPPKWSKFFHFVTVPSRDSWDQRGSQWIGGFNQLRADFTLPQGTIQSARAFVTGVGAFYMSINGERVGDHILDPGQTVYDVRTLYIDFDVKPMLKAGTRNTLGGELGHYKWTYLDTWCVVVLNVCASYQIKLCYV
jgi:alpha-L-rhamnosidase